MTLLGGRSPAQTKSGSFTIMAQKKWEIVTFYSVNSFCIKAHFDYIIFCFIFTIFLQWMCFILTLLVTVKIQPEKCSNVTFSVVAMVVAMDRRKNNGRIKGNHYKFRAIIVVLYCFFALWTDKAINHFCFVCFCLSKEALFVFFWKSNDDGDPLTLK